jgi:hypothetical protein
MDACIPIPPLVIDACWMDVVTYGQSCNNSIIHSIRSRWSVSIHASLHDSHVGTHPLVYHHSCMHGWISITKVTYDGNLLRHAYQLLRSSLLHVMTLDVNIALLET